MIQVAKSYHPRFIRPSDAVELINLFHLSRTALAGRNASRYDRMIWTAKEFHKTHSEVSETGVYKDLDGLLAR